MEQHNPYAAPQTAEFATPIMMDGEWTLLKHWGLNGERFAPGPKNST
jgi:hypothetical protein